MSDLDNIDGGEDPKIELKSRLRSAQANCYWLDGSGPNNSTAASAQSAIVTGDLLALLVEAYKEALAMGWETKILDSIADRIREAQER